MVTVFHTHPNCLTSSNQRYHSLVDHRDRRCLIERYETTWLRTSETPSHQDPPFPFECGVDPLTLTGRDFHHLGMPAKTLPGFCVLVRQLCIINITWCTMDPFKWHITLKLKRLPWCLLHWNPPHFWILNRFIARPRIHKSIPSSQIIPAACEMVVVHQLWRWREVDMKPLKSGHLQSTWCLSPQRLVRRSRRSQRWAAGWFARPEPQTLTLKWCGNASEGFLVLKHQKLFGWRARLVFHQVLVRW